MHNQEKPWHKKVGDKLSNVAKTAALSAMMFYPKESDGQQPHLREEVRYDYTRETRNSRETFHLVPITEKIHAHTYHPGDHFANETFLSEDQAKSLAHLLTSNPEHYNLSKEVNNWIMYWHTTPSGEKEECAIEIFWDPDTYNGHPHWEVQNMPSVAKIGDLRENSNTNVVYWDVPMFNKK